MSNSAELSKMISQGLDAAFIKNAQTMMDIQRRLNEQSSIIFNQLSYAVLLPDINISVSEIDFSVYRQAIDAATNIDLAPRYTQLLQTNTAALVEQIQRLTTGLSEIAKRIATNIVIADMVRQSISSLDFFKTLREAFRAKQDEVEAFCAAGWPLAPSMPHKLRNRVVELHSQGKTRYATQAIIAYYHHNNHQNLVQMVHTWREHFLLKPRFHIISDALGAHRSGQYTLSVPALMPQIEGVLIDYVKKKRLVAKLGKIREVYTAAIGDTNSYDMIKWAIVQTLLHSLQRNTYTYTNFDDEWEKSVLKRITTRHTVLHGISIHYDRPSQSLKAFLLLDAISVLE